MHALTLLITSCASCRTLPAVVALCCGTGLCTQPRFTLRALVPCSVLT
jgi:hypothetical protein